MKSDHLVRGILREHVNGRNIYNGFAQKKKLNKYIVMFWSTGSVFDDAFFTAKFAHPILFIFMK